MISLGTILSIIIIHFVADFVFQTDWQAKNKSKNTFALMAHTTVYSLLWVPMMYIVFKLELPLLEWSDCLNKAILFACFTMVFHTATDYVTSRVNTMLWNKGQVHNFFVSVGFDQVLHYAQLFGTYYILTL